MSEKTPKHVSQLNKIFDDFKDGVIMYGFDSEENTDKQFPLNLIINRFENIETQLAALSAIPAGNVLTITSFNIVPSVGIISHLNTLVFTIDLGVVILESDIQLVTLSDGTNTLLIDEYRISGTNLIIEDTSYVNITLEETTVYTFNIQLNNLSVGSATQTFTMYDQVSISNFSTTTSIDPVTKNEEIVITSSLNNYVDNVNNVITGVISSNTDAIANVDLVFDDSTITSNISLVDYLTSDQILTLTITQTVGDNTWTEYQTFELEKSYTQISLSNLITNRSNVVIGDDYTITFGTTASRTLDSNIVINLVSIVNDLETIVDTKAGDDTVNILFTETINLSETTSYRIDVYEDSWFIEDTQVLSSTSVKSIIASVEEITTLYWGMLDSATNDLPQGDIEALIALATPVVCGSDTSTSTPTFAFWTTFGNPLLPTIKSYQWLAVPKSVYPTAFTHGLDEGGQPPPYLLNFKFYTNDSYQMLIDGELTDCILYYTVTRMIPKNIIFSE